MVTILHGDCMDLLPTLPAESVQCVVTSPPYWGLRDYGIPPRVWPPPEAARNTEDGRRNDPCEHEFDDETVGTEVGRWNWAQAVNGRGEAQGDAAAFREPVRAASTRGFCRRCGAWRGVLGLEPTPYLFVEHVVAVFREVWRVLRKDGTLWLNLGDSYATGAGAVGECPGGGEQGARWAGGAPAEHRTPNTEHPTSNGGSRGYRGDRLANGRKDQAAILRRKTVPSSGYEWPDGGRRVGPMTQPNRMPIEGLKPKDLVGVPWRVALALQADGWFLRRDIIWHKPNPMPESCKDRPTTAHEYVFLLSKSERYHYDAAAISEPVTGTANPRGAGVNPKAYKTLDGWDTSKGDGGHGTIHRTGREAGRTGYVHKRPKQNESFSEAVTELVEKRNARSVWTIASHPFKEAHFATFPPALARRCILAGCRMGGTVLDPFGGSGTVGAVAEEEGRNSILMDLNPEYVAMQRRRTAQAGLFCGADAAAGAGPAMENGTRKTEEGAA